MGGGSSKPEQVRKIEAALNLSFSAHCNATATSQQTIKLKNVKVRARENCQMFFENEATVTSDCDITPIIEEVSNLAATENESFVNALMDADKAPEATTADTYTKTLNITKNLEAKCGSTSKAYQSLVLNGVFMECDGDATVTVGNKSDVRAMCLRTSLLNALDNATVEEEKMQPENKPEDDTNTSKFAGLWSVEFLKALLTLIILALLFWYITRKH